MFEIIPIYSFYKLKILKHLISLPLKTQIKEFKICVLDFCGALSKYIHLFDKLDASMFLIDVMSTDQNNGFDLMIIDYDLVYNLISEEQELNIKYQSISFI